MEALLVAAAYFSGSVPFGLILARAVAGTDIRTAGSGNIGATNVARVVGKKLGAVVLVLDAAKGALPVAFAAWWRPQLPALHVAAAVAAFVGHVFPVWLRFKGGKGVATALGVLAVLLPWSAAAGFVCWALIIALFRVSAVGSLMGAVVAIGLAVAQGQPAAYVGLAAGLLVGMLITHRGNLQRLRAGRENRV